MYVRLGRRVTGNRRVSVDLSNNESTRHSSLTTCLSQDLTKITTLHTCQKLHHESTGEQPDVQATVNLIALIRTGCVTDSPQDLRYYTKMYLASSTDS